MKKRLAGRVASNPVVSRLVTALAPDAPRALKAIRAAQAAARERAWALAGDAAPGGMVTADLDATIVTAHSDQEQASPTWGSPRTRAGARSSPWPASCWPGRRCSPWPARLAAGFLVISGLLRVTVEDV